MTQDPTAREQAGARWQERVGDREARKLRARRRRDRGIWFGLGTFGVVGWSVVAPTLLGLLLGLWVDRTWPTRFSWTLMLFLGGLVLGCWSAWRWVFFESGVVERPVGPQAEKGPDRDR